MTTFLLILILVLAIAVGVMFFLKWKAEKAAAADRQKAEEEMAATRQKASNAIAFATRQAEAAKSERDRQVALARHETEVAQANARQAFEQTAAGWAAESTRIREHYEAEARRIYETADAQIKELTAELESLRVFRHLKDAEAEVNQTLAEAITEATALREQAQALIESTRAATSLERTDAQRRAAEIRKQAEALLTEATRNAGGIVQIAEKRAEEIAGSAYTELRDKTTLESAVTALWNVTEGYGDRYVVPTHSLLDDLAEDFGHTEAGQALKSARDHSRRMVMEKLATTCNYEEEDRRERANRFVVDAFNGRVDAILSRVRHDNFGTLAQEIRDAFSVVNLNGLAFRDARIFPAYLDARLDELKWAAVALELKRKEREEQREIQERMREEEKARREYERALQEAEREEQTIRKAMEKARADAEHANAGERAQLEARLAELSQRLTEAEAKNQRALSMAQQTRAGHIYIISNVGSFGEEVFKIGMTRRLEPLDRVKELGDASVPFEFDVHAMIYSDDAPGLERQLHQSFDEMRLNKVNYRKEFFRLPLHRIRDLGAERALEATFTMVAEAREYRETAALEKMTPSERERYHLRASAVDGLDEN